MTVAPRPTAYDADDVLYDSSNKNSFGQADAGEITAERTIKLYNDKDDAYGVSTMENVTMTTVNINGEFTGGTVGEGQDIVDDKWLGIKSETDSETVFTYIGGATGHSISDIVGGGENIIKEVLNIPSDAAAGLQEFGVRVAYSYV